MFESTLYEEKQKIHENIRWQNEMKLRHLHVYYLTPTKSNSYYNL